MITNDSKINLCLILIVTIKLSHCCPKKLTPIVMIVIVISQYVDNINAYLYVGKKNHVLTDPRITVQY